VVYNTYCVVFSVLFVFVLYLVYPRLPVSLDCLFSSCILCIQGYQCLWIVHSVFSNVLDIYVLIKETKLILVEVVENKLNLKKTHKFCILLIDWLVFKVNLIDHYQHKSIKKRRKTVYCMLFISNLAVFQLYRGVIRKNRVIISNNISFLPGYRYFTHALDVCHLKLFVGGHISFSYCPWYVINIDFMYFSCTVTGSSSNPNFREIILILYLLYVGRRVWRYQRGNHVP
jgi:hypothetical protein